MARNNFSEKYVTILAMFAIFLSFTANADGGSVAWYRDRSNQESSDAGRYGNSEGASGESKSGREKGQAANWDAWRSNAANRRNRLAYFHLWKTKNEGWIYGRTTIRMNTMHLKTDRGTMKYRLTDLQNRDNYYAIHNFPQLVESQPPAREIEDNEYVW